MREYELEVQAHTDELFDALDQNLAADLTPYDAMGEQYIVDFEDGTALLVSVEAYEPIEVVYLGDDPRDRA